MTKFERLPFLLNLAPAQGTRLMLRGVRKLNHPLALTDAVPASLFSKLRFASQRVPEFRDKNGIRIIITGEGILFYS
jgi:hypothetical protein